MHLRNTHTGLPDRRRRAIVTMELILTLPILLIVLAALFELSVLFLARGSVVQASRIGARAATLPGMNADDVEYEVRRVMTPAMERSTEVIIDLGQTTGDVVAVGVRVPMGAVAPDLLWPIGFSLRDQNIYAETRMIRE